MLLLLVVTRVHLAVEPHSVAALQLQTFGFKFLKLV
jgi:hypothetical protein